MRRACICIFIIASALIALASGALVAENDCTAQLKQQEEQCLLLAEKRQELCSSGESAQCRQLSEQIANRCTHRPCGAPPKKASKPKAKRPRAKEREQ